MELFNNQQTFITSKHFDFSLGHYPVNNSLTENTLYENELLATNIHGFCTGIIYIHRGEFS